MKTTTTTRKPNVAKLTAEIKNLEAFLACCRFDVEANAAMISKTQAEIDALKAHLAD